ncbi:hypothetical protein FH966_00640 [Lentibacillus cibarius]|uniref:Uncharacterized protein n=1 Tax=Lentibacillus cibarius TaxID=2583219 RepID=A0A549YEN6_9BACI|nr:hypothetical protein [Lentibacillus cibarius]TRM10344.1 hypothetical protein FH966_00640 [Lentibacillus cibarius]
MNVQIEIYGDNQILADMATALLIQNGYTKKAAIEVLKPYKSRIEGYGNTRFVDYDVIESVLNPQEEDGEESEEEERQEIDYREFLRRHRDLINKANRGDKKASRELKKLCHPDTTPYPEIGHLLQRVFQTLIEGEKHDRYASKHSDEIREGLRLHSEFKDETESEEIGVFESVNE